MAQPGYLSHDTIAAIATPLGGAVSIVRVSGPLAWGAMERLVPALPAAVEPRRAYHARVVEPGTGSRAGQSGLEAEPREIDDALVIPFKGPASFTGEDSVEFHLHGSPFVARRLLEALLRLGIRQALPGEFSFRAVRNGKMTLSQAEAVADLVAASNESAVTLALEKMSGSQNELLAGLARELRQLATLGEVGIDFADQDVEEVSARTLRKRIAPLLDTLRRLEGSFERGTRIQEGIPVAFVGLPNAGKSSFFNALLGEDRSIVSEVAGTTRDVVREQLSLQGRLASVTLRLSDTAGLRETSDHVERIGVERTQKVAREADLVLLLVDGPEAARNPAGLEALQAQWRSLGEPGAKALGILTKADLLAPGEAERARAAVAGLGVRGGWWPTSARSGQGVAEAARAIADFCEGWVHRERGEVVLTRLGQVEAARAAIGHLERAAAGGGQEDLLAADLRQALLALAPLIGETVPDDILGMVFSQFCIGK